MFLNWSNNLLFRMTSEIKLYTIIVYIRPSVQLFIHPSFPERGVGLQSQSEYQKHWGVVFNFFSFLFFYRPSLPPAVVKLFLHTQTGRVVIKVCTAGNYDVCINKWRAGKPQTPPSSLSFTSFSVVLLLQSSFPSNIHVTRVFVVGDESYVLLWCRTGKITHGKLLK